MSPTIPAHAEPPPASLKALYQELHALAAQGQDQPYDLAIAGRIEALVGHHLAGLKAKLVQQESQKLLEFVATIADLGKRIPIGDFEDEAFLGAFGHAWGSHLDRHLRRPVERGYFARTLADMAGRCRESAGVLARLRRQRQELAYQIAEQEAALGGAGFKQRRELLNALVALKSQQGEAERGIALEEMSALEILLPPGVDYAALTTDPPPLAFVPEKFHVSAVAALFAWPDAPSREEIRPLNSMAEPFAPEPVPDPVPVEEIALDVVAEAPPEPHEEAWYRTLFTEEETPSAPLPEAEPVPVAVSAEEEAVAPPPPGEPIPEPEPAPSAYAEDCETAVQRFIAAYRDKSPDLGAAIENVAFHWIDRGYVNVAYTTLKSAQFSHLPIPSLLIPDLFKAAYFGMHVWSREDEALATVQRLLNFLSPPLIDELCARRPGGAAVPYLLFVASFQPALFGGSHTQAPALVEYAGHGFGESFRQRLEQLLRLFGNDGSLGLEVLRKLPAGDERSARAQLSARLADWHVRILDKQNGWGPVRAALGNCLARNEFDRAIKAIQAPDSNDVEGVVAFVAKYRDRKAIGALMEAQVASVLSSPEPLPTEERNAKSWFILNMLDLCGIANDWLAEQRLRCGADPAGGGLIGGVLNPLAALREEIERSVTPAAPFEQRVAARFAAQAIGKVRLAIEDVQSSVVWSAKQTNAWLSLPYDMMEAVGFSGDAEGELVWLVDRIGSVPPA